MFARKAEILVVSCGVRECLKDSMHLLLAQSVTRHVSREISLPHSLPPETNFASSTANQSRLKCGNVEHEKAGGGATKMPGNDESLVDY